MELNQSNIREFLQQYDTFILDCDGVLYQGTQSCKNADKSLKLLRDLGKRICIFTNSAHRTRAQTQQKLAGLGLEVEVDEVYTSSYVATQILDKQHKIACSGLQGMNQAFLDEGYNSILIGNAETLTHEDLEQMELDPDVRALVMGYDNSFSFYKLAYAGNYLSNPDVKFVACNQDLYDQVGDKRDPGAGSLVAAVVAMTGRQPDMVTGKPSRFMFDLLKDVSPSRTWIFGDRDDTDMQFGRNTGIGKVHTLTGIANTPFDDIDYFISHFGRLHEDYATEQLNQPKCYSAQKIEFL